ncbi:hypothetical protein V9K67_08255 [Paraflavisolibacter sp. H34]|uniref:hypothetical protein n=1 Tax=Huijunlia imazamoxiresistens TaxID=3127457 RepID=UPI0030163A77
MKQLLLLVFLFAGVAGRSQSPDLPAWFSETFAKKGLDAKYTVQAYLQPSFLQADFNGDGKEDIAVLVVEKEKKKKGILLVHGNTHESFLFGAGKNLNKGGLTFKSADQWGLYTEKTARAIQRDPENGHFTGHREVALNTPALFIHDHKGAAASEGWLIHWNGKRYTWIHHGH